MAGLFAFTWFMFPGFGLPDLMVTWNPEWAQVLEGAWGLFMAVFVGVPFVVIAITSSPPNAAVTQLYVAAAALAVSAVAAAEWALVLWGFAIALETALVAGVPGWSRLAVGRRALSWPLIVLALLGAGPWLVYAVQMWQLNRQDRADKDITVGIDHYSVQGGYGLAVVALVTIGAVWAQGRRFIGLCAGISTVYLGLISFVWHPTQGSFNQTWSVLCMLWGLAVAAVAIRATAGRGSSPAAAPAPT